MTRFFVRSSIVLLRQYPHSTTKFVILNEVKNPDKAVGTNRYVSKSLFRISRKDVRGAEVKKYQRVCIGVVRSKDFARI